MFSACLSRCEKIYHRRTRVGIEPTTSWLRVWIVALFLWGNIIVKIQYSFDLINLWKTLELRRPVLLTKPSHWKPLTLSFTPNIYVLLPNLNLSYQVSTLYDIYSSINAPKQKKIFKPKFSDFWPLTSHIWCVTCNYCSSGICHPKNLNIATHFTSQHKLACA